MQKGNSGMYKKLASIIVTGFILAGCTVISKQTIDTSVGRNPRDLSMFTKANTQCYDRNTQPYTFVVDAHNHFRPFNGKAIPMHELDDYFRRSGILFVNVYGIGQTLPIDSPCEYYGDCPGVKVIPSIKNDFRNASNAHEYPPEGIHLTLSMSFPDLAKPEEIKPQIELLDREYPGYFKWMGEVNLVKQALFPNGVTATPQDKISEWKDFMAVLESRKIPIAIHSDLGNNKEPTKYLNLMEEVLQQYPNNKIVWVHMGLSKELTTIDPAEHITIMRKSLDENPNLMLDISWRVLWDEYFSIESDRKLYVEFFNQYSTRILTGTDFVAARKKDFLVYAEEVEVNSRINRYLDDNAFKNIALGENYFRFINMQKYQAPEICQ